MVLHGAQQRRARASTSGLCLRRYGRVIARTHTSFGTRTTLKELLSNNRKEALKESAESDARSEALDIDGGGPGAHCISGSPPQK